MIAKVFIAAASVLLMAATPQQPKTLVKPKIIGQIVNAPGDMIHFGCPGEKQGTYHVFIQKPDGKIAVAIGEVADYGIYRDLSFNVPRDFKDGDYRIIGAAYFDHYIDFNNVIHVDTHLDTDKIDPSEAAYVQKRVSAVAKVKPTDGE